MLETKGKSLLDQGKICPVYAYDGINALQANEENRRKKVIWAGSSEQSASLHKYIESRGVEE